MKANEKTNLNNHINGGTVSVQTFAPPTAVGESTSSEHAMTSPLHNLMSINSENEMDKTVKKLRRPKGYSLYISLYTIEKELKNGQ